MSPLNMKKNIRVYESEVDIIRVCLMINHKNSGVPSLQTNPVSGGCKWKLSKKTGRIPTSFKSDIAESIVILGGGTLKEVHFHALRSSLFQCNIYIYMYGSTLVDIMEHEHQWEHPF